MAQAIAPDYALSSHVAPLGLVFSQAARLGENYRDGVFIGEHGSWERVLRAIDDHRLDRCGADDLQHVHAAGTATRVVRGDAAARVIPVKAYIRSAATGVISFSASDTMRAASSSRGKISSTRSVTR